MEHSVVCVGAGSFHAGGANVGDIDGSVRINNERVASHAWWGIATKAAGAWIAADCVSEE